MAGTSQSPEASKFREAFEFFDNGDYVAAEAVYTRDLRSDRLHKAGHWIIQGFIRNKTTSSESGRYCFLRAADYLRGSSEYTLMCYAFQGLGQGYFNEGNYDRAILAYQQMKMVATSAGLSEQEWTADFLLGLNYQQLGKIPVANVYFREAIRLAKLRADSSDVFQSQYKYAANYMYFVGYDSTTYHYADSVLNVVHDAENYLHDADYTELGQLHDLYVKAYVARDDYDLAREHAIKSLNYYILSKDTINITGGFLTLSQSYMDIEDYDSAEWCIEQAYRLKDADSVNYHAYGFDLVYWYNSYFINKSKGNAEKGLAALEQYFYLDMDEKNRNDMDVLQMREEFEKANNERIAETERRGTKALYDQRQQFILLSAGGVILFLLVLGVVLYFFYRGRKARKERYLRFQMMNAEYTALKAQMNPHYIFNALNSIQHSILTNKMEEASSFLSQFSKLIRAVLDSSSEPLIPLASELEILRIYVGIESRRFDHSFSYEVILNDPNNRAEKTVIPPMIIQVFIENAIWHGLMPKDGGKHLAVSISLPDDGKIICEVSDNGIGREAAKTRQEGQRKTHTSKGIQNITERAELLKRTAKMDLSFSISDTTDLSGQASGTKVTINFNSI